LTLHATNFLKIANFNENEVLFPPIFEQKQTVKILDEVFEKAKGFFQNEW